MSENVYDFVMLCTGTVLIEVGAAGNTLDQALAAVDPLSHAIIDLAEGTN